MKLKSYMAAATIGAGLLIANSANAQTNWVLGGNSPTKTDTLGNKTNQDLKIITNNKVVVTVRKTGYVGIGTTTAVAKLDVLAGTATKDTLGLRSVLKYAGTATDAVAISADAYTNTAAGYGIGVSATGNYIGVSAGGYIGVSAFGLGTGVDAAAVGADTTAANTGDLTGVSGISQLGSHSIGVYGAASGGNYNYGVYGQSTDTVTSGGAHHDYGVACIGDLFFWRAYAPSDAKLKTNITLYSGALDKVMMLNATSYNFNKAKYPGMALPSGVQVGFLAEDFEKAFPDLVKTGSIPAGAVKGERGKMQYNTIDNIKAVNYVGLIPVLAEAIKEQKQIVDQKEAQTNARIAQLENQIAELKAVLTEKKGTVTETGSLLQNVPNPANGNTSISFYLPENSKGVLQITDVAGKVVKSYKVSGSGMQDVIVNTANLSSGSYTYSLTLDGKVADSKTMVINK